MSDMKSIKTTLFCGVVGFILTTHTAPVFAESPTPNARATLEAALRSVQGQRNIAPILSYTDFDAFFESLTDEDRQMTGAKSGAELRAFYESTTSNSEDRLDKLKVEDLIDPAQKLTADQRSGLENNLPQIVEFAKQVTREATAQVSGCIFSVIELAEKATSASGKVKCETSGKSYVADVTLVKHEDRWLLGSLKFLQDILAQLMGMDNALKEAEKEKMESEAANHSSSL